MNVWVQRFLLLVARPLELARTFNQSLFFGIFSLPSLILIEAGACDNWELLLGFFLPAFRFERLGAELFTCCCEIDPNMCLN